MRPLSLKKRRIVFSVCLLFFVILGTAVFLYSQGYVLDKNLILSHRGGLYVSSPFSDAEFFVNNKKEKATGILNNTLFVSNLKIGEYSVLIATDGYWPWAKTLEVKEGLVTEARAFGVLENPKGEMLFKGKFLNIWGSPLQNVLIIQEQKNGNSFLTFYVPKNSTFLSTNSSFSEKVLMAEEEISNIFWENNSVTFKKDGRFVKADFDLANSAVSADYITPPLEEISDFERLTPKKDQKIWWDNQTSEVFVDWLKENSLPPYYVCETKECELPLRVFRSHFEIKNIDFYPERKDVILIAVGVGVYALEIDGRSGRLIYPIYKGGDPTFALVEGKIYILDNGSLMKIYPQ